MCEFSWYIKDINSAQKMHGMESFCLSELIVSDKNGATYLISPFRPSSSYNRRKMFQTLVPFPSYCRRVLRYPVRWVRQQDLFSGTRQSF